jgi:hypothetical protein
MCIIRIQICLHTYLNEFMYMHYRYINIFIYIHIFSHIGTGNVPDSDSPGVFNLELDTHNTEL